MPEITKNNLQEFVASALVRGGIDNKLFPNLLLAILQSRSIKLSGPIQRPNDFMEMIVIGRASRQAIRTSGNQVNVFAFSSVLIAAAHATPSAVGAAMLLVALMGSCSVNLTPEEAAFFVAAEVLKASNSIPTANAFAPKIGAQLESQQYSSQDVLALARQLKQRGVPLTIGDPPNNVIRHEEWTLSIPGF